MLDTSEGWILPPGRGPGLTVKLELATTDGDGTMHLRRAEGASGITAADLTLTTGLDLSGTITARMRKDEENDFARIDDPFTESGVPTWTSVFTVGARISIICRENENSVPLYGANGTTTPLACHEQPPVSSGPSCHDTPNSLTLEGCSREHSGCFWVDGHALALGRTQPSASRCGFREGEPRSALSLVNDAEGSAAPRRAP